MNKLRVSLDEFHKFKESELLYIEITMKEQTSRFASGIHRNSINLNYFILNLQGRSKLRVSLKEFHEVHGI